MLYRSGTLYSIIDVQESTKGTERKRKYNAIRSMAYTTTHTHTQGYCTTKHLVSNKRCVQTHKRLNWN